MKVTVKGTSKLFSPEQISAMVLGRMKKTAEEFLGKKVKSAVVTVPDYFQDWQRQATKEAGTIAGFSNVRMIDEPVAAVIAYDIQSEEDDKVILVFHLGGETLDISLLAINDGLYWAFATSVDKHLGGNDFDQRIMNHSIKLFKKKYGKDMSTDRRALSRLRGAVETSNCILSSRTETRIEIESLFEGQGFSELLTRERFEELKSISFDRASGLFRTFSTMPKFGSRMWAQSCLLAGPLEFLNYSSWSIHVIGSIHKKQLLTV